ncbi:hypothetical protein KKC45_00785 [Patescibacteria group bacterium]|nr:hypothetical protein [Patescibacteria group bacterium]
MQECNFGKNSPDCKKRIYNDKCPGQITGECVSSVNGGGGDIPIVCGKQFRSHQCQKDIDEKECPGLPSEYCLSIHVAKKHRIIT